mmetsp:Transcript_1756/g.3712  ORF Transcript_1756/g.3712 Transcript_1756/m.3712 type:complete len:274 (+) Transcript_1756:474-1295(+)
MLRVELQSLEITENNTNVLSLHLMMLQDILLQRTKRTKKKSKKSSIRMVKVMFHPIKGPNITMIMMEKLPPQKRRHPAVRLRCIHPLAAVAVAAGGKTEVEAIREDEGEVAAVAVEEDVRVGGHRIILMRPLELLPTRATIKAALLIVGTKYHHRPKIIRIPVVPIPEMGADDLRVGEVSDASQKVETTKNLQIHLKRGTLLMKNANHLVAAVGRQAAEAMMAAVGEDTGAEEVGEVARETMGKMCRRALLLLRRNQINPNTVMRSERTNFSK